MANDAYPAPHPFPHARLATLETTGRLSTGKENRCRGCAARYYRHTLAQHTVRAWSLQSVGSADGIHQNTISGKNACRSSHGHTPLDSRPTPASSNEHPAGNLAPQESGRPSSSFQAREDTGPRNPTHVQPQGSDEVLLPCLRRQAPSAVRPLCALRGRGNSLRSALRPNEGRANRHEFPSRGTYNPFRAALQLLLAALRQTLPRLNKTWAIKPSRRPRHCASASVDTQAGTTRALPESVLWAQLHSNRMTMRHYPDSNTAKATHPELHRRQPLL